MDKIVGLPWWMPSWLWRAIHHVWWFSACMGMAAYYAISLINDFTDTIPLWVRVLGGVVCGLMARLGIALDWRRIGRTE
jgi:hypothetical protein